MTKADGDYLRDVPQLPSWARVAHLPPDDELLAILLIRDITAVLRKVRPRLPCESRPGALILEFVSAGRNRRAEAAALRDFETFGGNIK